MKTDLLTMGLEKLDIKKGPAGRANLGLKVQAANTAAVETNMLDLSPMMFKKKTFNGDQSQRASEAGSRKVES